jgi:hypothetical protein
LQFGSSYGRNSNSNSCNSAALMEEIKIKILANRQLLWGQFELKFGSCNRGNSNSNSCNSAAFMGGNSN